ncbi:unnamed protein product [Caenorhabditis angaria]|uniref:Uncharacterized protein n=1 Tax=Caenorhabditis angaria TaxID=860376 RepID=A0A9P1I4X4_9PELO|nr:unnamed protein product [Caenorhabditis angaria]
MADKNQIWFATFTREQVVSFVSFAYVIISILMVLLWSMYLCIDGRRNPKKDTRVIHMLAQNTFFKNVP